MPTNGRPVLSSTLPTLHLDLLRAGDKGESKKLLEACRKEGFFYLDLTSDPALLSYWEEMLAVSKQYFEQPLEVKMRDARGSDNTGYEPTGTEVGPEPTTVDGYESLKISRREFLNGKAELSTSVQDHSGFFFLFMGKAHEVTMMMLERLSDEMGLEGSARFEAYHADSKPTLTNLALLRYPKHDISRNSSVGHNKHTDIGSLTFLLVKQWGLQVPSIETNEWAFVEPRPNHAVINVGDSLRFPSNGELASIVHRVIPIREHQHEDRYSIAYFLRVNDDLPFKDSTGKLWSAKEWHDFKFDTFRSPDSVENGTDILTGMMEKNHALINHVAKTSITI